MQLCAGHIVELVDADQQQLGHVQIVRQEAALLFGTFQPGAAFWRVAQLFRDFEAAVDVQALHAIETLDTTIAALGLHLRDPRHRALREELLPPRLERAIGVIYRPETELASHYFYASLPLQFDELIWFDETRAVAPLPPRGRPSADLPETYPFGL